MAQDNKNTYNPFLQGIGATSPYSSYLDTNVFKGPKKRKLFEVLPGEVDVSRGGRILQDIGGGIAKVAREIGPPEVSKVFYEKLLDLPFSAFSYLSEKPQSEEFLQAQRDKDQAQRDKDFASQIRPAGILGLQDEIETAREAVPVTPIDIDSIGVARPSFQSPTPIQDFKTIDKSVPGDMSVLQESVSQETEFTDKETIGGDPKSTNPEDLLNSSLVELYGPSKSLTGEDRTKAIEQYKKDFYEATGLDPSGKPDTKDAMVAFGLALMQNKAGKKLNIRKIFGEVGKAGEKVLPLIQQAKKESKSGQIAAGQFALSEVAKDEEKQAQYNNEKTKFYRELYKERLKDFQEKEKALEIARIGGDPSKELDALANLQDTSLKIGATDIKLKRAADPVNQAIVFFDPVSTSKQLVDAYAKTEGGLEALELIESYLIDVESQAKDTPGGQIGFLLGSKGNKFLKLIGFSPDDNLLGEENKKKYFTEDGVLKTDKIESLQLAIMSRFKRFMTQETGNGISNVDVKLILQQFGDINFFTDFAKGKSSVNELKELFNISKQTLDPIILQLSDRSEYRFGQQGDIQFEKVQKDIKKGIFGGEFKNLFEKIETSDPSKPIIINVKDL